MSTHIIPCHGCNRHLFDYAASLKDDIKTAAKLLQEYARDERDACRACGWYHDHRPECDVGNYIARIETT